MTRQAVIWIQENTFASIMTKKKEKVDTPLFPPSLPALPIPRSLLTFHIQTSINFWHQCSTNMTSSFFKQDKKIPTVLYLSSCFAKCQHFMVPAGRATESEPCVRMWLHTRLVCREIDLFGTQWWRSSAEDFRAFHGAMRSGEWQRGWYTIWGPTSDPQIRRANMGPAHCACVRSARGCTD